MANAGSKKMETEIIWIEGKDGRLRWIHSLKVPEFVERNDLRKDDDDNFGLVWKPCAGLREARVKTFLAKAKKMKIEEELALEMLLANDYNAEESIKDLQNWKVEHRHQLWGTVERHKFQKAYFNHGKKFTEIQKHFPKRSLGEIIMFYLNWKRKHGIANRIYVQQKQKEADMRERLKKMESRTWDQLE
ncbi:unnamed protein product [Orchesella dallaii]|uniref:SANT domain-containing protein n=1 Tax=Orchesella dallaii TaxID=48710 RepID=A0ABP1QNR1_9HEXA